MALIPPTNPPTNGWGWLAPYASMRLHSAGQIVDLLEELLTGRETCDGCNYLDNDFASRWAKSVHATEILYKDSVTDLVRTKMGLTYEFLNAVGRLKGKLSLLTPEQQQKNCMLAAFIGKYLTVLKDVKNTQDFHLFIDQLYTVDKIDDLRLSLPRPSPAAPSPSLSKSVSCLSAQESPNQMLAKIARDVEQAVLQFGLKNQFPEEVIKAVEVLPKDIPASVIAQRRDLRKEVIITIDPETAKDFDDALSLTKTANGLYRLGVHIADVSHYVASDSVVDKEAKKRANSFYFPHLCLPMLPPQLSENLCSLQPNVDRLAITVEMLFDKHGSFMTYKIFPSVINSQKRFTYQEAKGVLDGNIESPHRSLLKTMEELALILKKQRTQRHVIDLSLPEKIFRFDEKGTPIGFEVIEHDVTHQLVEEFMLKANEVVATDLARKNKNIPYRVHPKPDDKNTDEFLQLVKSKGYSIPENFSLKAIAPLFAQHEFRQLFAKAYGPRMKKAFYDTQNTGHYGLQLEHYCHFTSPIRRYADLEIHRILLGGNDDLQRLNSVAEHCSDREITAAKAEAFVKNLHRIQFALNLHDRAPDQEYESVVTNVQPNGFAFEVPTHGLDGFFYVSEQDSGNKWKYDNMRIRFLETGGQSEIALGTSIGMHIKEVCTIKQEISWSIIKINQGSKTVS